MREPPDPTSFKPRDIRELLYLARRFDGLGEERMYDTLRFWTMSARIFSMSISKARSSRRTWPAARSSARRSARARRAPPTCCCITTWATSTIRSAPGVSRAAAWARSARRSAASLRGQRRQDPQSAHRSSRSWWKAGAPVAWCWPMARSCARNSWSPTWTCAALSSRACRSRICRTSSCRQVRNFKIRGSSGKLNIALDGLPDFPAIPAGLTEHSR